MRGLHAPALAALAACLPLPALAAVCSFATECVETEPCQATEYAFDLVLDEWRAALVSPAGTVEGQLGVTPSGATYVIAVDATGLHLLTILDAAGTARYTTHLTGPGIAVTYHGLCEEG